MKNPLRVEQGQKRHWNREMDARVLCNRRRKHGRCERLRLERLGGRERLSERALRGQRDRSNDQFSAVEGAAIGQSGFKEAADFYGRMRSSPAATRASPRQSLA